MCVSREKNIREARPIACVQAILVKYTAAACLATLSATNIMAPKLKAEILTEPKRKKTKKIHKKRFFIWCVATWWEGKLYIMSPW